MRPIQTRTMVINQSLKRDAPDMSGFTNIFTINVQYHTIKRAINAPIKKRYELSELSTINKLD